MNCRKGDLALVVKGRNFGAGVTCLEFLGKLPPLEGHSVIGDDYWKVDRMFEFHEWNPDTPHHGRSPTVIRAPYMRDSMLKPLRDDGEKEAPQAQRQLAHT